MSYFNDKVLLSKRDAIGKNSLKKKKNLGTFFKIVNYSFKFVCNNALFIYLFIYFNVIMIKTDI